MELWLDGVGPLIDTCVLYSLWRRWPLPLVALSVFVLPKLGFLGLHYKRVYTTIVPELDEITSDLGQFDGKADDKVMFLSSATSASMDPLLMQVRFLQLQNQFPDRPWRVNWHLARGANVEELVETMGLDPPTIPDPLMTEQDRN